MQSAIPETSGQRSAMGQVALLAVCQALGMSCLALSITITALVGAGLAPTPALATLPLSLQFIATAAMTIPRSEEHTSELQSLMRISYAVFCLKKKKSTILY